jgi:ribonuclease E
VTCPRCNGVGVIRDTESSALHILRILQEEAMKEGTASVHAQVPVEVATFLLNEKRGDIAKLEARLRVSVVLIPNKFIDTPHYHIERLKHDDPRLEDVKASFERAADLAPSTDTPYAGGKASEEQARTRQEAVVKGIVPETPAPMPAAPTAPRAATAPTPHPVRAGGWWDKVVAFFSGEPANPIAPATTAATAVARSPRADDRGADQRRGRSERDGRREGRRDPRRDGKRRDEKRDVKLDDKRQDSKRDEIKEEAKADRRDGRRGERTAQPRASEGADARRPRAERRPDKAQQASASAETLTTAAAALPPELLADEPIIAPGGGASLVSADPSTAGVAADEPRRRRRRRRGRGSRDGTDTGSDGTDTGSEGNDAHSDGTGNDAALDTGTHVHAAPEGEAPRQRTSHEERAGESESKAQPSAAGNGHDTRADAVRVPAPAALPQAPVAASGVVVMRTPDMVTIPATIALPAAHPAPLPMDDLQPVLELAGLTLVQTEPAKRDAALSDLAEQAAAPRPHRERPRLPPLEEAPLMQVETTRNAPGT